VIEALWPGFVDLHHQPQRIAEVAEATAFPPLARLLLALNATRSPVWTCKCDVWKHPPDEPAPSNPVPVPDRAGQPVTLACYVDLLPCGDHVFTTWQHAETFCRACVTRLAPLPLAEGQVELIVRQAIAAEREGFGVTAYCSGAGHDHATATQALAAVLSALADSILSVEPPTAAAAKLQ
jgi:hypothetical protein